MSRSYLVVEIDMMGEACEHLSEHLHGKNLLDVQIVLVCFEDLQNFATEMSSIAIPLVAASAHGLLNYLACDIELTNTSGFSCEHFRGARLFHVRCDKLKRFVIASGACTGQAVCDDRRKMVQQRPFHFAGNLFMSRQHCGDYLIHQHSHIFVVVLAAHGNAHNRVKRVAVYTQYRDDLPESTAAPQAITEQMSSCRVESWSAKPIVRQPPE